MTTAYSLRVLDKATDRGDGRWNEDVIGSNSSRAWIIDGGTDVPETLRPDPKVTGSFWISRHLNRFINDAPPGESMRKTVFRFASAVADVIRPLRERDPLGVSPICSIAIVERREGRIIVSRIGDVTVYFPRLELEIGEKRFGRNEESGVGFDDASGESSILTRRIQYLQGCNGMWVLGDNPQIERGVSEVFVDEPGPEQVLISSDGLGRAVSPYRLFDDWKSLARAVEEKGAGATIATMRQYERQPSAERAHYKLRDDASVMLISI